jgi:peroxiredoxin
MIETRAQAPDFTLKDQDGEDVSLADFRGKKLLIVFFPFAFSGVCSDQLSVYQSDLKPYLAEKGIEMVAISVDHIHALRAFQEKLGVDTTLLADFEPKGEVAKAYGSWFEPAGMANRTLVLVDEDGKVEWAHEAPSPGEAPAPELVLAALSG